MAYEYYEETLSWTLVTRKRTSLLRPTNYVNGLNHDDPNNASVAACKTDFDYFVVSDFCSFVLLPSENEKI